MAMARFLNRLRPNIPFAPLPTPSKPICIIGDIHGRSDLLDGLIDQLSAEASVAEMRVIFVGDLIDRGPDSLGVLKRVHEMTQRPKPFAEAFCLMGNHERMMLDFLTAPALNGPRWLASGGDATLQSFGLSPYHRSKTAHGHPVCETSVPISAEARLTALRDALLLALQKGLHDWLLSCPLLWHEGALVVTHAGADPSTALSRQSAQNLLWGHPDFLTRQRSDGKWVAHGHTITATPTAECGRISVDTGAYRTGRLTAAVLDADGVKFVSTAPQPVKSSVTLR